MANPANERSLLNLWFLPALSSWLVAGLVAALVLLSGSGAARAHEVNPAIADLQAQDGTVTIAIRLTAESLLAGIDLEGLEDTGDAENAADYDRLRALPPAEIRRAFEGFWPQMQPNLRLLADGAPVVPEYVGIEVPEVGDTELPRASVLQLEAALPAGTSALQFGWPASYGAMILRQNGVEDGFAGYVAGGSLSPPMELAGGSAGSGWDAFLRYIPIGFDHIVPKGLDHILFVLGLFFLSPALRPLLWQVSAFTAAHTVTLALGALGLVNVPASIVEPLIAASIVYVAAENVILGRLGPWRPAVVFCFGLLHGLGFASVLEEFGLPEGQFIPALIGFNIGVELGQLAVIAVAFLLVGLWFRKRGWYRARIEVPASLMIAAVGAWWFYERVFL